jgi:hypothetical protein
MPAKQHNVLVWRSVAFQANATQCREAACGDDFAKYGRHRMIDRDLVRS